MKTVSKRLLGLVWMTAVSVAGQVADAMESPPLNPSQMREAAMERTDLNGDGLITEEEFARSNHLSSPEPASLKDIRAIRIMEAFRSMDDDADGVVSGKEYLEYLQQHGG